MPYPAEAKNLPVRDFGGLELETADQERPPNSWARLVNFDQFVSGSIRKIEGWHEFIDKLYDSPITAIRAYRRTPNDPIVVIGISAAGGIYNLETGVLLATLPTTNFPFVGFMDGIVGARSSGGDSYSTITNAITPGPNNPLDGVTIQYLVSTTAGFFPYKWNGQDPPTVIGVSEPDDAVYITGVNFRLTDTDPNPGTQILVSRRYRYTWWNPSTRHESSPSPDVIGGSSYQSLLSHNSFIPLRVDDAPVTSIQLNINAKTGTHTPPYGDGYTRIRFYATRDGGDTFFLCHGMWTQLSVGPNIVVEQADADESLPVGFSFFDGAPVITPGTLASIVSQPPTPDPMLVEPAPDIGENNPPPPAIWGAIYQGRLWLVDANQPNRLVFSKIGEFESFPFDNFFPITADEENYINALDGQYQQLVIGTVRSSFRLIGTDFTDFVLTPLDPQVNFVGRRALAHAQGSLFFFSTQGLMQWQSDVPGFYGRSIRPLTDTIPTDKKLEVLNATTDSFHGLLLFATTITEDDVTKNAIIVADLSQQLPFSVIEQLPGEVWSIQEVSIENGQDIAILFGTDDCRVYILFSGSFAGVGGEPVAALAETQVLPQDDLYVRKIFRRLKVMEHLVDFTGWQYSFSVDGRPFTAPRQLQRWNTLSGVGREVVIRFLHNDNVVDQTKPPILSNYFIEYTTLGESR